MPQNNGCPVGKMLQDAEVMYCHQQICIPPTFPYLLRQYAKAAIRSQPNDLLRYVIQYHLFLKLIHSKILLSSVLTYLAPILRAG